MLWEAEYEKLKKKNDGWVRYGFPFDNASYCIVHTVVHRRSPAENCVLKFLERRPLSVSICFVFIYVGIRLVKSSSFVTSTRSDTCYYLQDKECSTLHCRPERLSHNSHLTKWTTFKFPQPTTCRWFKYSQ
ncbi:hypothetical protein BCR42DRAFT_397849 [Absidia repens]|uniref:Uncharacterized protein n=1 Tax=Absidia repens TaxID=90262 RepID=A0A1X2HZZ6_9FUNG|nr:hypothetical protein BCR42DRAFT_397849 [Absidia repens]